MKKLIIAGLLSFVAAMPAKALTCTQLSGGLGLCIPSFDSDGDQWGQAMINSFNTLNAGTGTANSQYSFGRLYVSSITALGADGLHITSTTFFNGSVGVNGGNPTLSGATFIVQADANRDHEFALYGGATSTMTLYFQTHFGANFQTGKIESSWLGINYASNGSVVFGTGGINAPGSLSVSSMTSHGGIMLTQSGAVAGSTPKLQFATGGGSGLRGYVQGDSTIVGDVKIQGEGGQPIFLNIDGGNVSLGSAMTVVGAVTVSTLSLTGAGGIRFSDGSAMTTAASGSAGGNNTWTGMNVFVATTTIFQSTNGDLEVHASGTTGRMTVEFNRADGTYTTIGNDNSSGNAIFGGSGNRASQTVIQNGASKPISFGHTNIDVQVDASGHFQTFGSTPSISSCGTNSRVLGTDNGGRIIIGTGSPSSCVINFANAWTSTYVNCIIEAEGSLGAFTPYSDTGTSSMTIKLSGGGSFTAGDDIGYDCKGAQ